MIPVLFTRFFNPTFEVPGWSPQRVDVFFEMRPPKKGNCSFQRVQNSSKFGIDSKGMYLQPRLLYVAPLHQTIRST